jgi:hypothetical protein
MFNIEWKSKNTIHIPVALNFVSLCYNENLKLTHKATLALPWQRRYH